MRYSSGRRSRKTLMEERIPSITEKSSSAAMISSCPPAWLRVSPPGVDKGAAAAVAGVPGGTAGVAQRQEHLVFNGSGPAEGLEVEAPFLRPLAHHKEQVHPLEGQGPRQLRETDVVADDEAAVTALQGEPAQAGPPG